MKINEVYHGFRLQRVEDVPEAAVTAHVFEHEKSGARLLYLKTTDDNKVFSPSAIRPAAAISTVM